MSPDLGPYLYEAIDAVRHSDLKVFVLAMALNANDAQNPVRTWLLSKYQETQLAESTEVIDFQKYANAVDYELNEAHCDERSSKQYDSAFDAASLVSEKMEQISSQVKPHSSLGTKQSALESLVEIGNHICDADDTLGEEVRKKFGFGDELNKAMLSVVENMDLKQRWHVFRQRYKSGKTFGDILEELISSCDGFCIFEGLQEVFEELRPEDGLSRCSSSSECPTEGVPSEDGERDDGEE